MLHGVINDTAFRNGYRKFIARWWVYHIIVVLSLEAPFRPLSGRSNDSLARSLVQRDRVIRWTMVETIIDAFYNELSVDSVLMSAVECHELSAGYYPSCFFIGPLAQAYACRAYQRDVSSARSVSHRVSISRFDRLVTRFPRASLDSLETGHLGRWMALPMSFKYAAMPRSGTTRRRLSRISGKRWPMKRSVYPRTLPCPK